MRETTLRFGMSALVMFACLATSGSAYAVPPPPPAFPSLTLRNTTGFDIGVRLELYPTFEGNRMTLDQPIVLTIPRFKNGASFLFGLNAAQGSAQYPSGAWGISKIHVSAAYYDLAGAIYALPETPQQMLVIEAHKNTAWPLTESELAQQPVPNTQAGYAGYAYMTPGGANVYQPSLVFAAGTPPPAVSAELKARWGWNDANWSANPDNSPIDGKIRDRETFIIVSAPPAGCPCPSNP